MEGEEREKRVCVTGAGGFVGSRLVKHLLATGHYVVHGTVRDPCDPKNGHLKAIEGACERLRLFKADLLDYATVSSAVAGCGGVFHVASPVPATTSTNPEVDLLAPAVTGTVNVLKACHEAKVGRVVVVSSVAAVIINPKYPGCVAVDEDWWSDEDYCRTTEKWYCLSKTLAEREVFTYSEKTGLNVVTICPPLVIGPLLQSTVNTSSLILINYLKSETVEDKVKNWVDVRDLADAIILAYESSEASGRLICSAHTMKISDIVTMVKSWYPTHSYSRKYVEAEGEKIVSSKKLQMLGWKFRPAEETIRDSVESYKAAGILNFSIRA